MIAVAVGAAGSVVDAAAAAGGADVGSTVLGAEKEKLGGAFPPDGTAGAGAKMLPLLDAAALPGSRLKVGASILFAVVGRDMESPLDGVWVGTSLGELGELANLNRVRLANTDDGSLSFSKLG